MKSQRSSNRRRALLSAACAVIASATPCAFAQTVQMYEYQPDRIYPVRAGLGISTQIELSPEEKILDYSTGFSSGWISSNSHPLTSRCDSRFQIATSR